MFDETYGTLFREDIPYEEEVPNYTKENWEIGFGLQAIDGLKPSKYLVELAEKQVAGKISYQELEEKMKEYHASDESFSDSDEADFSAMRIAKILATNTFGLRPPVLVGYHKQLFSNIESFNYPVGEYRTINIKKTEDVLNGDSVQYSYHEEIDDALGSIFEQERRKSYRKMSKEEVAYEAMDFIATIWHIHPFREGNTRTAAVYAIKYYRHLGFKIDNEPFKNHAQYFRDSLTLASAEFDKRTDKYLRMFTENIVLGGQNELVIPKQM